ncbi:50S ribosomal protein L3 [Candidatus Mycoplasma haematominutum]|uniref:50S ribosomal protein L3 n=1 Tax=Candidatus Mycoplasma haematominutum 'Birmingham 1' TaxID=1116213 RepID=G8C314_9MOLU|nr:50S ribosomal protein L3 [Candidatus Mycoplasma haematominutum]CCE66712.1 ribosomal protein L3 [Candidatus Mycoplasma haematominutum 'Birmingham 1']
MREVICQKIGMSSVFAQSGEFIPVTFVRPVPTQVLFVKRREKFGYSSIVVGIGEESTPKHISKPVQGQFREGELPLRRKIGELSWDEEKEYKRGDFVKIAELFQVGELIKVQGISRGMGFTGAIKRWNFATSPKTHGSGYPHRYQGSLETGRGGRSAQKVWKGKKMSGRAGAEKCTIQNLKILHIDSEKNMVVLSGSVPGRKKSLVRLKSIHKARPIVPEKLVAL